MKLLVTGGAGFIGSNFVRYITNKHPRWEVTNLDKLTYAGNLENLKDVQNKPGYQFLKGDITNQELIDKILSEGCDSIINFAAESHVDRSILDAAPFLSTNVLGTGVLLESARKYQISRFIQVSTDEVYGSIDKGCFNESSSLSPSSPYAASKAAADLLALTYCKTHRIPVIITRCTNNYGPHQFPEKLIPLVITNALEEKPIPVYGDGSNVRDWIFVYDHCRALDVVLQNGKPGEIYNIASSNEISNIQVIQSILRMLDKPESLIQFVSDRPAHDRRYSLDVKKITEELGWRPEYSFNRGLMDTVSWYQKYQDWWHRVKSGEYIKYYERMYINR